MSNANGSTEANRYPIIVITKMPSTPITEIRDGSIELPFRAQDRSNYEQRLNGYCQCTQCESVQRWDEMSDWYCRDCWSRQGDDEDGYFSERPYSSENLADFQSRGRGKYIKSGRIFSAELECYYPNSRSLEALNLIPEGVGISGDGSLGEKGIELQTPKLKGAQGEKQLKAVCKILREGNFTVDRTTGLHIHLDGRGLLPRSRKTEPIAVKQLWYFYHMFDSVMLSFLPSSRRANQYCKPTKQTARADAIVALRSLREAEELWYSTRGENNLKYRKEHKYDSSRYAGLNLHSLFADRHVEIRFHGGTLNSIKILEWTALHQAILDKAANKELPLEAIAVVANRKDIAEQTRIFFELLGLPERTKKYFLQRQKTFDRSNSSEGQELEDLSETN